MTNRIIVALDGSALAEISLPHALAMAKLLGAQIDLLRVVEPTESLVDGLGSVDPLIWRFKKNEAEAYLSAVRTRLEPYGIPITKTLREGRAVDQIGKQARDSGAELLIMSSVGQHQHGDPCSTFSPTVRQILDQRLISTVIVRTNTAEQALTHDLTPVQYKCVMVPLDGSRRAEATIPTANRLAQEHNARLLLVHVVGNPEMARRIPISPEDVQLARQLVERNQAEGEQYLAQLQAHLGAHVQTVLEVSDQVATTLQQVVEREGVDLMVMSAHGYSGATRWPYGSVTHRFISDGSTPLLVVQDLPFEVPEAQTIDSSYARISGR